MGTKIAQLFAMHLPLVLLSILMTVGLSHAGVRDCAKLLEAQKFWNQSRFTDPNRYDDKSFRYLIHAFRRQDLVNIGMFAEMRFPKVIGNHLDKEVYQRLNITGCVSASVIDQDCRGMFGPFAVILKVFPEQIFATSPRDIGFLQKTLDRETTFFSYFQQYGLDDPDCLMNKCKESAGVYNEVVVADPAWRPGIESHFEVIGFVAYRGLEKMYSDFTSLAQASARRRNIPIIWISPPYPGYQF